jgi:hypothetical protein
MRRAEWAGPRGAVMATAGACFALYLAVPDAGFGGGAIKVRFAWAVFLLGCVAVPPARLAPLHTSLSLYIACFLTATLISTMNRNARAVSAAAEVYANAMEAVPQGARFIRLRFPAEAARARFGFQDVALDPLLHMDAWIAVRRKLLDLSDYQALSSEFPVDLLPLIPDSKQLQLWLLEGGSDQAVASFHSLLRESPVPIDYVVLVGDGAAPERPQEFAATVTALDSTMQLVSATPGTPFVRVYKNARPLLGR